MADPGEGPGGPGTPSYFETKLRPEIFFGCDPATPTPPPPPPTFYCQGVNDWASPLSEGLDPPLIIILLLFSFFFNQ